MFPKMSVNAIASERAGEQARGARVLGGGGTGCVALSESECQVNEAL